MKKLRNLFKGDPWVWWCFLLLSIVSLIAVFSTIGQIAGPRPLMAWSKHLIFVVGAWVTAIALSHLNYRTFAHWSNTLLAISAALLVLVMVLFPGERAIPVGSLFRFQPSEVAKIALIIYMSRTLAVNSDKLNDLNFFIRLLVVMGVMALLIVKENFSTAALVSIVCFFMMLYGGVNTRYWRRALLIVTCIAGGVLAVSFVQFSNNKKATVAEKTEMRGRSSTWGHRLETWWLNDKEADNQFNTARMAIARGGISGKGPGNTVHARLMTQSYDDFIYAIIIEEGGSFWGLILFATYAFLCFRCIRMATRCRGTFGSLLLGGLGTYIFVQAIVHMAYNVGALPVTGQTLPLVSYGGTSYLMFGVALGIIQSVSADVRRKEKKAREEAERQRGFEETFEIAKENV